MVSAARVQRSALHWEVCIWWNERIADGCQLEFMEDAREGNDWVGPDRWKKYVSIKALHRDFCRARGFCAPFEVFTAIFSTATLNTDRRVRKVKVRYTPELEGVSMATFVRFGPAPTCPLPV